MYSLEIENCYIFSQPENVILSHLCPQGLGIYAEEEEKVFATEPEQKSMLYIKHLT